MLERQLIARYGRRDLGLGPLVNGTDGGDGMSGHFPSAETRARRSASISAAFQRPDVRARHHAATSCSAFRSSRADAQRKAWTVERREQRSAQARTRWADPKFKSMMAEKMKSVRDTPEYRAQFRKAHNIRSVQCVETGRAFDHAMQAVAWLATQGKPKAQNTPILRCCRGEQRTAYGHQWIFAEKESPAEAGLIERSSSQRICSM